MPLSSIKDYEPFAMKDWTTNVVKLVMMSNPLGTSVAKH